MQAGVFPIEGCLDVSIILRVRHTFEAKVSERLSVIFKHNFIHQKFRKYTSQSMAAGSTKACRTAL